MGGIFTSKFRITDEGGYAIRYTNKTGAASVKGMLVQVYDDTAIDEAVDICDAAGHMCIGAIYEDGIADGSEVWVVIGGVAEVLLEDTTAATRNYWVKTSDTAGRADATNSGPPGGGVSQLDEHTQEIGHCLESQGAGTDVLCKINMHFL